jgi:hypothetical protein
MRKIFACATVLALAMGMTGSAMAFDHGRGLDGHAEGFRAGNAQGMRSFGATHGGRFAGVRGFSDWRSRRLGSTYGGHGYDSGYGAGLGRLD